MKEPEIIYENWRQTALVELTELLSLLVLPDFSQQDYCDRLKGISDYAMMTTDPTDRTPPRLWPLPSSPWTPPSQGLGSIYEPILIDDRTNPEDL